MNKKPGRQDFNQKDQNFIKAFNLAFGIDCHILPKPN